MYKSSTGIWLCHRRESSPFNHRAKLAEIHTQALLIPLAELLDKHVTASMDSWSESECPGQEKLTSIQLRWRCFKEARHGWEHWDPKCQWYCVARGRDGPFYTIFHICFPCSWIKWWYLVSGNSNAHRWGWRARQGWPSSEPPSYPHTHLPLGL